jgi:LacI family transcriptional regulator
VCAKHGLDMLLSPCTDRALEQSIYDRLVKGRRVAGVIVTGVRHNDSRIAYLSAEAFPFVVLGRPEQDEDFAYIDVDSARGVDEAVQHLIDLGWRRSACIGLATELLCADDRLAGYRRALERNGLAFDSALELLTDGRLRRETVEHNFQAGRQYYSLESLCSYLASLLRNSF